jgi:magnesium-transporting ATPase (P-type)
MGAEMKASPAMTGLSAAEAAARLKAEGFNELPRAGRRSIVRLIADVLREPMLLLLLAGGGIYFLLGDLGEAVLLLCSRVPPSSLRWCRRRAPSAYWNPRVI